jgi:hypothetical protein
MLSRANGAKYNNLKQGMKENFVMGTREYPKSPEAVLQILNAHQQPAGWNKRWQEAGTTSKEGAIFAQTKGGDNSWKLRQDCFKCGERGHIAWECPEKEGKQEQMHVNIDVDAGTDGEDLNQGENIFVQKKEGGVVNKNWVLLDSQSTANQVANPGMLTNIRKGKNLVTIHCNAGSTYSALEGEFGNVMVKHNPHSIANVLSLYEEKQHH